MAVKRFIDVMVSLFLLILFSPVILLLCVLIRIESPGSPIFKQKRIGKNGEAFDILKLRSMSIDTDCELNYDFTKDEERVTTIGKFIRRAKLDEILQLINVFKGEMSLVGPRPTIETHVIKYSDYQRLRLNVKPGITGLAQVKGNTALSWDQRIMYDVHYVKNWSLFLDIFILGRTIVVVLFGEERCKTEPPGVSKGWPM